MWGHRLITLSEDLNLEIFKRDRQASRETLSQRRIQSKTNTAAHDEYKCKTNLVYIQCLKVKIKYLTFESNTNLKVKRIKEGNGLLEKSILPQP